MTGLELNKYIDSFPSRDRELNPIAEQVADRLLGEYTIDNEKTQRREFYSGHKLVHSRPRDGCNGLFHALWGSFPCA